MNSIGDISSTNFYIPASRVQSNVSSLEELKGWQKYELKFVDDSKISLTPIGTTDLFFEVILTKSNGNFTLIFSSNSKLFNSFVDNNGINLKSPSSNQLWRNNGRASLIVKDVKDCQRLCKALLANCDIESKELNSEKFNSLCEKFNSFIVPVTSSEKFLYRFLDLPVDDLY